MERVDKTHLWTVLGRDGRVITIKQKTAVHPLSLAALRSLCGHRLVGMGGCVDSRAGVDPNRIQLRLRSMETTYSGTSHSHIWTVGAVLRQEMIDIMKRLNKRVSGESVESFVYACIYACLACILLTPDVVNSFILSFGTR